MYAAMLMNWHSIDIEACQKDIEPRKYRKEKGFPKEALFQLRGVSAGQEADQT